ncbi:PD-(D/E)XK motif protein [Williamsia serinedens]|uniref:PD-(D/E)XK family member, (DUF4420) n=1 Tax=Williamsia serinedens TaxID=391736 RepID=A0ABT1H0Y5_9NOCA|nr:PD-(D/E)XK motif protein [Williamsia serinedens]MCP2160801.1 putative PD-(D/E)XK family member, (DUF4420) [Williamsia serinedens]
MGSDPFESIWKVQETDSAGLGLSVNDSGFRVRAGTILLGLDSAGARHLLIPLAPGESCPASERGEALEVSRIKVDGAEYLSIACLDENLRPIFSQFSQDVVESIEQSTSPASAAYRVFLKWKSMFLEAMSRVPLSDGALAGLIGELLTLEKILNAGGHRSIDYWTGPVGSQHDFRTKLFAIEVKASLSRSGRRVQISSIDQLDSDDQVSLWLNFHRMSRDPAGENLAQHLERVLNAGADTASLTRKLSNLGLDGTKINIYDKDRFKLLESNLYLVDQNFPRIVRSSFKSGRLPAGIVRMSYDIELATEPPTALSANSISAVFDEFAKDS